MSHDRWARIQAMLEERPNDTFLNFAAAQHHHQQGSFKQAESHYQRIIKLDADYVGAYYHLGLCLEAMERRTEAIEVVNAGIQVAQRLSATKDLSELQQLKFNLELDLD